MHIPEDGRFHFPAAIDPRERKKACNMLGEEGFDGEKPVRFLQSFFTLVPAFGTYSQAAGQDEHHHSEKRGTNEDLDQGKAMAAG